MAGLAVLDWSSRPHHLIRRLAPSAHFHRVRPGVTADELLGELDAAGSPFDAVLMHVDASEPTRLVRDFDRLRETLGARGCAVWNGAVDDIRKRSLQALFARLGLPTAAAGREGDPAEQVIVKTNLNSRGIAEWEMPEVERIAIGLGPRRRSVLDGLETYRVMARADVPLAWWTDDDLAIERYVANDHGRFARAYICGDNYVLCTGRSAATVRRMSDAVDRFDYLLDRATLMDDRLDAALPAGVLAPALATLAVTLAMGLDFAAIDLVEDAGGVPYVVDVNLTPYWGVGGEDTRMLGHLAAGLG
jgi:hypothetical protein